VVSPKRVSPKNVISSSERKKKLSSLKQKIAKRTITKLMQPFTNRVGFDMLYRIEYTKLFRKYLDKYTKDDNNTCMNYVNNDTFDILDGKIVLTKKLGYTSKFALIYMAKGTNEGDLFRCVSKITRNDKKSTDNENTLITTNAVTPLVLNNKTPHFPITYKIYKCNTKNKSDVFPKLIKNQNYFIFLNELANGDLKHYITSNNLDVIKLKNAILQIYLSLLSLHSIGFLHGMTLWENFLYHKVKPEGYIKYKIFGKTIYLKNIGTLWVVSDFNNTQKIDLDDKDLSPFSYSFIHLEYLHMQKSFINEDIILEFYGKDKITYGLVPTKHKIPTKIYDLIRDINKISHHIYNTKELKTTKDGLEYLFTNMLDLLLKDNDLIYTENTLPSNAKIVNNTTYNLPL
jgi:hypothetical protein